MILRLSLFLLLSLASSKAAINHNFHSHNSLEYSTLRKPRTTPEQIEYDGYPVETHHFRTEDGYLLSLHRIPYSKRYPKRRGQSSRVIFIPHCIFCSSIAFLMLGERKSFAYMLSDTGYDVWMLNTRGTSYTNHTSFPHHSRKYWDFSLLEPATIDLPTGMRYVLDHTKVDKIDLLAFSMGTTLSFIMLIKHPDLNDRVRKYVALAPVAYVGNASAPISMLSPYESLVSNTLYKIGVDYLPPREWRVQNLLGSSCNRKDAFSSKLCKTALFSFAGATTRGLVREDLGQNLLSIPDTTSVKIVSHYAQLAASGAFQEYDYGRRRNHRHYKSSSPPSFDLRAITAPIALFSSRVDMLAANADVEKIRNLLPNVERHYKITDPTFSHIHFVWGSKADKILYVHILNYLFS